MTAFCMLAFGAQAAMAEGFEGPSYKGATNTQSAFGNPTGSKPESKLWVHHGRWWAVMWNNVTGAYHIYWLDPSTDDWNDTGTMVDGRRTARADVLSVGNALYIATHRFSGASEVAGSQAQLRRFIYNPATRKYSLDFTGTINNRQSETLVIDQDSAGDLWATWTQGPNAGPRDVMVARSTDKGRTWTAPLKLGGVPKDDISSLIAFGNQIGVMWNDNKSSFKFRTHAAGTGNTLASWSNVDTVNLRLNGADDHINLKAVGSTVYAAVKSSSSGVGQGPLVLIMRRNGFNNWDRFGVVNSRWSRPIVLINVSTNMLQVFGNGPAQKSGTIFMKEAPLSSLSSLAGAAESVFIRKGAGTNPGMVDPTATKQNLGATTGLVVLASNEDASKTYWHNNIGEPSTPPPPPPPPPAVNVIRGDGGNNRLVGTSRRDIILGGGGNDRIFGRGGNDRLVGGRGNDRIVGGLGHDSLRGQSGRDTLIAKDRSRDAVIGGPGFDRARRDRGRDRLRSIERII